MDGSLHSGDWFIVRRAGVRNCTRVYYHGSPVMEFYSPFLDARRSMEYAAKRVQWAIDENCDDFLLSQAENAGITCQLLDDWNIK